MKKFLVFLITLVWVLMPVNTFAKERGRGMGQGRGRGETTTPTERVGERVGEEVLNAVADEVAGKPAPSAKGLPPGLAKKGELPPGLAKQGKVPPGWDKGRKEGWDSHPDSRARRLIRGLFRQTQ